MARSASPPTIRICIPVLEFAKSDALRRRMSGSPRLRRAYPKNRDVLQDMMQTRYEIATLLGYSSWADYNAADKMIGKGATLRSSSRSSMPPPPAGATRICHVSGGEAENRSRSNRDL